MVVLGVICLAVLLYSGPVDGVDACGHPLALLCVLCVFIVSGGAAIPSEMDLVTHAVPSPCTPACVRAMRPAGGGAGIQDIIWFRSFVPRNDGEYVGALLLCFVVGVFASGLRVWRAAMETRDRIARNTVRPPAPLPIPQCLYYLQQNTTSVPALPAATGVSGSSHATAWTLSWSGHVAVPCNTRQATRDGYLM